MKIKEQLADAYLSYFNDYLTIEKFAEHNRFTIGQAVQVIDLGRKFHDERAEEFKITINGKERYTKPPIGAVEWWKKRNLKEEVARRIKEKEGVTNKDIINEINKGKKR